MIHPLPSKRSAILSGMIAAATLFLSVDSAQAGAAELKAINAQLPADADINGAKGKRVPTRAELLDAVQKALDANTKLKPGLVAGEALKSVSGISTDAGNDLGNLILNEVGATNRDAVVKAVGDAAKTAGTGKGANASEVPAFARLLLDDNTETAAAANAATASKSGVGAIFGGRASELAPGDRDNLVNDALQSNARLGGAVQEIARFVAGIEANGSTLATDSDEFALSVAQANTKFASSIAVGASAGDTDNAGEIVRALVNGSADLQAVTLKGALSLASKVAAVADIEQITIVGKAIADRIGVAGTNGKPLFKPTQAAALVKTLAKAILLKPIGGSSTNLNKQDEIAEVAAFVVNGVLRNGAVTEKTAPKLVLAIIKAAVSGGKASKKQAGLAPTTNYIADIAGSVALTVANSELADNIKTAIRQFLLDPNGKQAKAIGGPVASAVTTALTQGFRGGPGTAPAPADGTGDQSIRFEDGNIPDLALIDPETDKRNF